MSRSQKAHTHTRAYLSIPNARGEGNCCLSAPELGGVCATARSFCANPTCPFLRPSWVSTSPPSHRSSDVPRPCCSRSASLVCSSSCRFHSLLDCRFLCSVSLSFVFVVVVAVELVSFAVFCNITLCQARVLHSPSDRYTHTHTPTHKNPHPQPHTHKHTHKPALKHPHKIKGSLDRG